MPYLTACCGTSVQQQEDTLRQKIEVIGRLGKDPETKKVRDTTVTNLSVGASVVKGDEKTTTWYRAQVWGSRGEACAKYLAKGDPVFVEGDLKAAINGKYLNLDIQNARVVFLSKGEKQDQVNGSPASAPLSRQEAPQDDDSDLPF